jgi:alpha-galactosidase
MPISINAAERVFHLRGADSSYVMKALPSGLLAQLYWGKGLRSDSLSGLLSRFDRRYPERIEEADFVGALDIMPSEYPTYGLSDFRPPALEVRNADGSSLADLRYEGHRLIPGKPGLPGLPSVYAESDGEAESLEISLLDSLTGLRVRLLYTSFSGSDAIARSVSLENSGKEPIRLERALSLALDLKDSPWEVVSLSGSWARERSLNRQALKSGSFSIESARGESSHQQSPFLALVRKETTETAGTAYGFSLVYSGNFLAQVDIDQFRSTRVLMGVNPFDWSWLLEPGERFQAPEAVMVHSASGLGAMSRTFHDLFRKRLARGHWRDRERPVLVNNWEATYFDFNADKIEAIARAGKEIGAELLVLDDGWFGHRDSDNSSLGDWKVDERKLPGGLAGLARRVNALGLMFGLWFEPEMVSPDSELYRAHPDWCVHVTGRERTLIRNQCVLDLTRKEVRDYVVDSVSAAISSAPVAYVKWDMNRPLTEMGSAALPPGRQREFAHRYVLGVYDIMERVTSRFPEILFESCSGGGARFDAGIMHYMPQAWTSDDMDPFERLKIQWSTSLAFPSSMMGAHVCSSPNHSTGRESPMETRAAVAMAGAFGYELDLTRLPGEEKEAARVQIAFFKAIRRLVQFGDFHRLASPYEGDEGAWMYVDREKSEAFVVYVRIRAEPNPPVSVLRLAGLDPLADYAVAEGFEEGLALSRAARPGSGPAVNPRGGDELMNAGIAVPRLWGDLKSVVWRLLRAS